MKKLKEFISYYTCEWPLLVLAALVITLWAAIIYAIVSESADYPQIEYCESSYRFHPHHETVELRKGYILDEGHSYDIVETEEGYDMVFHFVKDSQ